MKDCRIEKDSMGEVRVPASALYGAQTQRAIDNFSIGRRPMPPAFIKAVALIKASAAEVNRDLGLLEKKAADAIVTAAESIAAGEHIEEFPVDVFQTGSGTSTNMNMNEVLATLASRETGLAIGANDHVNMGQSSNDTIPTAIHLSASLALEHELLPALAGLAAEMRQRSRDCAGIVKTGRTHLMDAMPMSVGQEFSAWALQVERGSDRVRSVLPRLHRLAQGGTAIGTGINAPPEFSAAFARRLGERTGIDFRPNESLFESLSCQDTAVELSGQLKTIAVSLMKIANDLRLMNSGPLAGLGEVELPALQPGSSIMPAKVNPVIPEAVAMASAQVIGQDVAISVAGQSGLFQLNVMLPLIAVNLLSSIDLIAGSCRALGEKCIRGLKVRGDKMGERLALNPIIATALNPRIGYLKAAEIAKEAYASGRPVLEVAVEMTELSREELERLLDPAKMIDGGIQK